MGRVGKTPRNDVLSVGIYDVCSCSKVTKLATCRGFFHAGSAGMVLYLPVTYLHHSTSTYSPGAEVHQLKQERSDPWREVPKQRVTQRRHLLYVLTLHKGEIIIRFKKLQRRLTLRQD